MNRVCLVEGLREHGGDLVRFLTSSTGALIDEFTVMKSHDLGTCVKTQLREDINVTRG